MYKLFFYIVLLSSLTGFSQELYQSKSSNIRFFSSTSMENIEANNKHSVSIINMTNLDVYIKIPVEKFSFANALMQEHFNEKYMESDKYPHAVFKGKILNPDSIDLNKNGTYKVKAEGTLNIHGVSKKRIIDCTFTRKDGQISIESTFKVLLTDHNIEVPQLLFEKIAEVIDVFVTIQYHAKK